MARREPMKRKPFYRLTMLRITVIFFLITQTFAKIFINRTDLNICKLTQFGTEYQGHIAMTAGEIRCQSWYGQNQMHEIDNNIEDEDFPERSMRLAKNYCRNPTNDPKGPWCYTMDPSLIDDDCGIPLCNFGECRITGIGAEYGGTRSTSSSSRKCKSWDHRMSTIGGTVEKFPSKNFPDTSRGSAKYFCRNPDNDVGGPWCWVEEENFELDEKEFCDVPFCDDRDCLVYTRNASVYSTITKMNNTIGNFTFWIKLWNPGSELEGEARLLLSLLPIPTTSRKIAQDWRAGTEILLSNRGSGQIYPSDDDEIALEPSPNIILGSQWTAISVLWADGFISVNQDSLKKPIFLAEYTKKDSISSLFKNEFMHYGFMGTGVLWSTDFCQESCEVHTTFGLEFIKVWPFQKTNVTWDINFNVRANEGIVLKLYQSPANLHPVFTMIIGDAGTITLTYQSSEKSGKEHIKEAPSANLLDYLEWKEFTLSIFGPHLRLFSKRYYGNEEILYAKKHLFSTLRWFSVGSNDVIAHWTFFCAPEIADGIEAPSPPNCIANPRDFEYNGSQWTTVKDTPCIPWISEEIPDDEKHEDLFPDDSILKAINKCRNPSEDPNGPYCYTFSSKNPEIMKKYCSIRNCRSSECRRAGTANDYVGTLSITRSGRTCAPWVSNFDLHEVKKSNNTSEELAAASAPTSRPSRLQTTPMNLLNGGNELFGENEEKTRPPGNEGFNSEQTIDDEEIGKIANEVFHIETTIKMEEFTTVGFMSTFDENNDIKISPETTIKLIPEESTTVDFQSTPDQEIDTKVFPLSTTTTFVTQDFSTIDYKKFGQDDEMMEEKFPFNGERRRKKRSVGIKVMAKRDKKILNVSKPQKSVHKVDPKYLNDTLYPERSAKNASNYCRDPSKNMAGTWCYTTDPLVPQDLCAVRDCEKPEECTFLVRGSGIGRHLYILPEHRSEGLHFALKAWEPDHPDSITFVFLADDGLKSRYMLKIGTADNEKVMLYYQSEEKELELMKKKTLPHLLYLGKWSRFVIKIPRGKVQVFYEGSPSPLFEWKHPDPPKAFLPIYYYYSSEAGHTIGVSFDCLSGCPIEKVDTEKFNRIIPVSTWKKPIDLGSNRLEFMIRARGVVLVPLFLFPATPGYFALTLGEMGQWIFFLKNSQPNYKIYHKQKVQSQHLFTEYSWTNITILWFNHTINVLWNGTLAFNYEHTSPLLFYFFSLSVDKGGWATWTANCLPPDIDGNPEDGGWSEWGSWACSASCNGGVGIRKRHCNNPVPNVKGEPCMGPSTMTGRCNMILCGDITEDTENLIRKRIHRNFTSLSIQEGNKIKILADPDVIDLVTRESPDSDINWSHNGIFMHPENHRILIKNYNIVINRAEVNDSGVYTITLHRVDGNHMIMKLVSLAVLPVRTIVTLRETLPMTIACHCMILGYLYSDLKIHWTINKKIWKNYGSALPLSVNIDHIPRLNLSHRGLWECHVVQQDLNFIWTTNAILVNVLGPPNWKTYLMEDELTRIIFGWMPNENFVARAALIIFLVLTVTIFVGTILYMRFQNSLRGSISHDISKKISKKTSMSTPRKVFEKFENLSTNKVRIENNDDESQALLNNISEN